MGKIAFVFPGQGAQHPGMGKSLYDNIEKIKNLYDEAEKIMPGIKEMSFDGTAEQLRETKNTQPCLYLADISAALALGEKGIKADAVAGFSLGEIAALAYSGAYTVLDGFRIVCKRGALMQQAAEKADTAMAAVLKLSPQQVKELCSEFEHIYPVNFNSPQQTVIAGEKGELQKFKERAAQLPCRVMDLAVSAAFHSPYMSEAAVSFKNELAAFEIAEPKIPVYSNTTAVPYCGSVAEKMGIQIENPVLWTDTVLNMVNDGVDTFIETGTGKTLSGLIKRISSDVKIFAVEEFEHIGEVCENVGKA